METQVDHEDHELAKYSLQLFGKKKKKRRSRPQPDISADSTAERDYTYIELLQRLKKLQGHSGQESKDISKDKVTLPQIQLEKMGSKRIRWCNFGLIASRLKRASDHVHSFFESETAFNTSTDTKGSLILLGKTSVDKLRALLVKYMNTFVQCRECKKCDTTLKKDRVTRLTFLVCADCGSQTSTPVIQKIFRAKTRADRKKEREHHL